MDFFLQHIRGTNTYRVDYWVNDHLNHTHFRIRDYSNVGEGWNISGCPVLVTRKFESRYEAMEALMIVVKHLGLDDAYTVG